MHRGSPNACVECVRDPHPSPPQHLQCNSINTNQSNTLRTRARARLAANKKQQLRRIYGLARWLTRECRVWIFAHTAIKFSSPPPSAWAVRRGYAAVELVSGLWKKGQITYYATYVENNDVIFLFYIHDVPLSILWVGMHILSNLFFIIE